MSSIQGRPAARLKKTSTAASTIPYRGPRGDHRPLVTDRCMPSAAPWRSPPRWAMVGVVATLFVVGCGSSPTFEDAATSNTGLEGGTSVSIPVPAGSGESGDVLVAILGVQGNPNTSGPDGWTAVPGFRGFNGATCQADGQGTACQLAVYTKLADDSDTSASFSWGGTRHAAGAIVRFSNVDSAAPIGAAGPARGSSNEPRAPVITTTRDGSRVLRIVVSELDDARPQLQGTLALTDEPPTFRLNVMSFPDAATDPANGCGPPLAACDATDRAIALAVSDTLNSVAEPSGPATWELPGGDQWVTASIEIIRAPEQ